MKSKFSRRGIIGIVVAAIVLIGIIVVAVWYNAPTQKVQRLLDLGQQYLMAEDYEQAVATYKGVLSIDPKNETATGGIMSAYTGWGSSLEQNNDYEKAISVLDDALTVLPDNQDIIKQMADTYLNWSEVLVADGDYDKAKQILNEGYGKTSDERLKSAISDIEEKEKLAEYEAELQRLATEAAKYCEASDYESASKLLASDVGQVMDEIGTEQYICHETGNKSVGIYSGGNYLYYGDYSGDIRQGNGVWISTYNNDYEIYTYAIGEWSSDMPNGRQEQYYMPKTPDISEDRVSVLSDVGSCVNGLWEGDVVHTCYDGAETLISFRNGKFVVISTSSYGNPLPYQVGTEIKSGSILSGDLYADSEDLERVHGIYGCMGE